MTPFTFRLTDPEGRTLTELEVEIDAEVVEDDSEPRVTISGVYMDAARLTLDGGGVRRWRPEGNYCLSTSPDPLLAQLGARIANAAEDDDAFCAAVIEDAGYYLDGHPSDPATRWRRAA